MRVCDFNKIRKEKTAQQIINMYIKEKIQLTDKQLNELIKSKEAHKREYTIDDTRKRKIKLKTRINSFIRRIKGDLYE